MLARVACAARSSAGRPAVARPVSAPRAMTPVAAQDGGMAELMSLLPSWSVVSSRSMGHYRPPKTHSGAKKRLIRKSDGSYKFLGAGRRHKMNKNSRALNRDKGKPIVMDHTKPDWTHARRLLKD